MKHLFILLVLIFTFLIGCSRDETEELSEEMPELIEVSINIPETIKVNEEIVIEAIVTQGNEKVDDAKEVKFDIWKSDQNEKEKIVGNHKGNGVYAVTKTFKEAGKYFVIAHVTARNMHNMPKMEFTVKEN